MTRRHVPELQGWPAAAASARPWPLDELGPVPRSEEYCPATADEELLCCLGPAFPALAGTDPERIRRIEAELASGFGTLAGVAKGVSIQASDDPAAIRALVERGFRARARALASSSPGREAKR